MSATIYTHGKHGQAVEVVASDRNPARDEPTASTFPGDAKLGTFTSLCCHDNLGNTAYIHVTTVETAERYIVALQKFLVIKAAEAKRAVPA